MPFIGGYFTNGNNGGFVSILGNTVAAVNSVISAEGYRVCDGSTFSDPRSPIFNVAGRYLPNLTDDRFLMGDTAAGGSGGDNEMDHNHTMAHTHTMLHTHYIDHTHGTGSLTLTDAHMPYHTHPGGNNGAANTGLMTFSGPVGAYNDPARVNTLGYSGGNQPHNHGQTGTSTLPNSGGASNGTTSAASNATTSGATVTENRPKFLSCLYIMKVF
jgi:hypothetical protein